MYKRVYKSNLKKRLRAPNFSADEKIFLMNIINRYKAIVDNKKSDAATLREKNNAWSCIANEYNAGSIVQRTIESIKIFYDNQKRVTHKKVATERGETHLTGGGSFKVDDEEMFILTVNPHEENTHILPYPEEIQQVPEAPKNPTVDWTNHRAPNFVPLNSKLGLLISNQEAVSSGSGSSEEHAESSSSGKEKQKIYDKEWKTRRRPAMSATASVSQKYEEVADAKLELANVQLSILKRTEAFQKRIMEDSERKLRLEEAREEQLFSYKLRKEELDVAIKEAQLELLLKQNRSSN